MKQFHAAAEHGRRRRTRLIDHVYRRQFAVIKRQLTRKLGCEATACDIAQAAFVALAEHDDPAALRDPERFVFRVALNLAGTAGRNDNRRRRLLAEQGETVLAGRTAAAGPEEVAILRDELDAAARIISRMPPRRRKAVLLFLQNEMTVAEIAAALDISETAVRSHLSRGLRQCRAGLRDHGISRSGAR